MKQGPPVGFVWGMPNLLPVLLPWLAVLGLLALPSNRKARAWWILAPLVAFALLGLGLKTAFDPDGEDGFGYAVQAASAAAFGLGAIWLLGAGLAQRRRVSSIVLMTLAFAAVSLLAFGVSPVAEQIWELRRWEPRVLLYVVLFWLTSGLVYAGAVNLTGRMCCKRFSRLRVSGLLPLWLWVMWIASVGLLGCVVALASGERFEWSGLLIGPLVLALVSYLMILPFLGLSFACPFYRERLRSLLRLPAPEATPASAPPPPLADAQVARP